MPIPNKYMIIPFGISLIPLIISIVRYDEDLKYTTFIAFILMTVLVLLYFIGFRGSNKLKLNIDKIKEELKENTVVFAGPSGVGKSSLLNEVDKNFELKTGEVSDKIKRGKHTTRHAELLKLECGGMVADTPGFSSLTLDDIDESELKEYFIEFDKHDDCRFGSRCIHENEPSCAVKEAVENGEISKKRYESYIQLLNEIRSGKRRY